MGVSTDYTFGTLASPSSGVDVGDYSPASSGGGGGAKKAGGGGGSAGAGGAGGWFGGAQKAGGGSSGGAATVQQCVADATKFMGSMQVCVYLLSYIPSVVK